MDKNTYSLLEQYMLSCMDDSAHDTQHVYRVLYNALDIAREEKADKDILIAACLLHDIGRVDQFADPSLCHAQVGADKAHSFLMKNGFSEEFAEAVAHCIRSHRFRRSCQPQTVEAKILFDADKLDVVGAMGVARTLLYNGRLGEPLYSLHPDGSVSDGIGDTVSSFFHEYHFKLKKLYDHFYTPRGAALAQSHRQAAEDFYQALLHQVESSRATGTEELNKYVK